MTQYNQKPLSLKRVSRRKAVKQIVGGVSALAAYNMLPVRWEKPIMEQIFLPVHAAVSGITLSDPCTVELVSGSQDSSIDVIRVSGFVTPPVGGLQVTIVATPNGGSGGPVTVTTSTASDGTYSAEITMVGGPGIIGVGATSTVAGVSGAAYCSVGVPPGDRPQQPEVTLTVLGQTVACGADLQINSNNGVGASYIAQLSPSPSADQAITVEFFINDASNGAAEPWTVGTSGFSDAFSIVIIDGLQAGDILKCLVTYPTTGATAECINPLVAPTAT